MTYNHLITPFPAGVRNARLDRQSPDEILTVQNLLFQKHVRYTAVHSPFYKARFEQSGIDPHAVKTLNDLHNMPPTTKDELAGNTDSFLAVPAEDIADVCLTSASTSTTPTAIELTLSDLARIAYNEEAAFGMLGVTPADTLMVGAALDRCFMAGLAYFLGAIRLGARAVRAGSGSAAQHWEMLRVTRPTVLVAVPSLMQRIADHARSEGQNVADIGVTRLAAIGEATRDANLELLPAAQRIEKEWGAPIYSTYASTEIATTFCECSERRGGHLRPERLAFEILDENDQPCPDGVLGEVVVTPLGVTGMPLLRFRTDDIACRMSEPCPCGRNTPRISPVLGRKNQMLKYKGTTLFPGAIVAALEGHAEVAGAYVEAHRAEDGTDRVVTCVALSTDADIPESTLAEWIRSRVRVIPEIKIISIEECETRIYATGKRKRATFFDLR